MWMCVYVKHICVLEAHMCFNTRVCVGGGGGGVSHHISGHL